MNKYLFTFLCFIISPAFATYNTDILEACSADFAHTLIAFYKPNTYTCSAGNYLPAKSITCSVCPSGYTCVGGSYVFNPKSAQGLVYKSAMTQKAENACSNNLSHDLIAIYTPNKIQLNWDDGTNITQNTCQYGGAITLPPTPVRPGYVFGGWKIKNQN